MAEQKKTTTQVPKAQVSTGEKCGAEDCKQAPQKAGFCNEHFSWFKAGLITKEGKRAQDFDKKYYHYTKNNNKNTKVA